MSLAFAAADSSPLGQLSNILLLIATGVLAVLLFQLARRNNLIISARSLWQHRTRSLLVAAAVAFVTILFVLLLGIVSGVRNNLLEASTTLMTGHVNIGGFYKVTSGQAAPVVTDYEKLIDIARKQIPNIDYMVTRGRGWARAISETGAVQVGIGAIDIDKEPGFRRVIKVLSGNLDDLRKPNSVMLFRKHAEKTLEVKVGDSITLSAPTARGTNNTIDVTVVAIAQDVGLMSEFNIFMNIAGLRQLYQLKDTATGVIQIYLKDFSPSDANMAKLKALQATLRTAYKDAGYFVMDDDPQAFFMKFEKVTRENWTGQGIDITNWEDETSFVQFSLKAIDFAAKGTLTILLMIILVGVVTVMWVTIRERTREIGTLRAVGMQRLWVVSMFLAEGVLLGLLSTIIGGLLGFGLSLFLNALTIPLPMGAQIFLASNTLVIAPTFGVLAEAVIVITFLIGIASLLPSYLASRLKPVDAMSHVG